MPRPRYSSSEITRGLNQWLKHCGHPLSVDVAIVSVCVFLSVRKSLERLAMFAGTCLLPCFFIIGNQAKLNAFFLSSAIITECILFFCCFNCPYYAVDFVYRLFVASFSGGMSVF